MKRKLYNIVPLMAIVLIAFLSCIRTEIEIYREREFEKYDIYRYLNGYKEEQFNRDTIYAAGSFIEEYKEQMKNLPCNNSIDINNIYFIDEERELNIEEEKKMWIKYANKHKEWLKMQNRNTLDNIENKFRKSLETRSPVYPPMGVIKFKD